MTKLIVGLGNPDQEYQNTRHNVGFMFLDYFAKKLDANDFTENKKHNAMVSKSKIEKTSVILAKPLSYVNKSGEVVLKLAKFYKIKPADIIIIQDDLDIEFGSFKLSFGKNSGGHKGIESIIKFLKTKNFWRLRIGTAVRTLYKARQQSDKKRDTFVMDFVLSKFSKSENEKLNKLLKEAYLRLPI
jgi:PTH1 family peptidyl-tRNA hydrolase